MPYFVGYGITADLNSTKISITTYRSFTHGFRNFDLCWQLL